MDNVALNGNAMFSVLRNACGQSIINETCGSALVMPQMDNSDLLPMFWNVVLFVMGGALVAMVSIMLIQAFRMRRKEVREEQEQLYGPGGPFLACSGSNIQGPLV